MKLFILGLIILLILVCQIYNIIKEKNPNREKKDMEGLSEQEENIKHRDEFIEHTSDYYEKLIDKTRKGWNWLDQSYYMDKRYDGISGNRLRRLKSLKDQVPALDFLYVDVWYAKGSWDSRQLGREIHSLGLYYTTEFPQDHEYDAIWNHWAVDYKYGAKTIKVFAPYL